MKKGNIFLRFALTCTILLIAWTAISAKLVYLSFQDAEDIYDLEFDITEHGKGGAGTSRVGPVGCVGGHVAVEEVADEILVGDVILPVQLIEGILGQRLQGIEGFIPSGVEAFHIQQEGGDGGVGLEGICLALCQVYVAFFKNV